VLTSLYASIVQTHDRDLRSFSVREVNVSIEKCQWDESARGDEKVREKILHP